MQEKPLKEMASILMTQIESLIKMAELVEPRAFLKLAGFEEKTAPVKEKYASACSEVEGQLRTVLEELQKAETRSPDLEAKVTQAIERVEELKKPYL